MILGDTKYLLLLFVVTAIFSLLKNKEIKIIYLLVVSICYYLTFSIYNLPILIYIIFFAFYGGICIEKYREYKYINYLFILIIICTLLPLLLYKYIIPIIAGIGVVDKANWSVDIHNLWIPIGISFYTFSTLGYLIDVYTENTQREKSFLNIALFCSFFPYVTSGPIPRSNAILDQFNDIRDFEAENAIKGIYIILTGVALKMGVAEHLFNDSNKIFDNLIHSTSIEIFFSTIFFTIQLYTDFYGYTLIAIGSALIFGIKINNNFKQPFFAETIVEFWKRWHISLTNWLRDYLYMPISFSLRKHQFIGTYFAAFFTLFIVGIWHGTGIGYFIFGIVHGILLILSMSTISYRNKLINFYKIPKKIIFITRLIITFLIVNFSLVLVRSKDLTESMYIYKRIFSLSGYRGLIDFINNHNMSFILIFIVLVGDYIIEAKLNNKVKLPMLAKKTFLAICVSIIVYSNYSTYTIKPFIYFQF
jgi:D-alanyl-lipoteichoic acid acyltransferase DltB (MBOAT superfamily)